MAQMKTSIVLGSAKLLSDAIVVDDSALMTKASADAALEAKGARTGSFDLVLIPIAFPEVATPAPIAGMDEARWKALAEDPLVRARTAMQCASELVKAPGGAVCLVVPEVGITGIAQLAAQSMATEGARSMAKSAAKVWLARGITVNTIAVALSQVTGATDNRPRPALDEIGKLALTLTDARIATGNTIFADGGEVTSI
jgi:NAD(P)-dependent dehydrogenase (short-subunit alcohol dehydrogenase family)